MFKNKNLKKFISIVCITLTQQHIYPILQNSKLQAINFTVKNNDNEENLTVTLDEKLHCLIVQPQRIAPPEKVRQDNNTRLLLGATFLEGYNKAERTTTRPNDLGAQLHDILTKSSNDAQVLLTLNPTNLDYCEIPDLPYTQLRLPTNLTNSLTNKKLEKLITKYPTLKTTLNDQEYIPIVECQTSSDTDHLDNKIMWSLERQQKIKLTPGQLHKIVPKQLITVEELKEWLSEHNPEFWTPFAENPIEPRPEVHIVPHKAPEEIKLNQQSEEINPEKIEPTKMITVQNNPENPQRSTNNAIDEQYYSTSEDTNTGDANNLQLCQGLKNAENWDPCGIIPETEDKLNSIFSDKFSDPYVYVRDYQNRIIKVPRPYEMKSVKEPNFFRKVKEFIKNNPKTSVAIAAAIPTLVRTIINKIKQSFTRKSQKSQTQNQVTQKYN